MNPRNKKLRLQRTTIRNLTASTAEQVVGGSIHISTKDESEMKMCDPTGQVGCSVSCFESCLHTACGGCYPETEETCFQTCDYTCMEPCDSYNVCP